MNNDNDPSTLTINLDNIVSTEFSWSESDMSSGFIAQELTTIMPSAYTTVQTGASGSLGVGNITITGATGASGSYTLSTPYEDMETRLAKLEKIIADEEETRRTHPAVQTAYDHYRLLLVLSGKISTEDLEK